MANNQSGTSEDTKTIVTVLLLIFLMPIGLILMWVWTKWKLWVKLLVSIPVILFMLFFGGIVAAGILSAINPSAQINKANCMKECRLQSDQAYCVDFCSNSENYPVPKEK